MRRRLLIPMAVVAATLSLGQWTALAEDSDEPVEVPLIELTEEERTAAFQGYTDAMGRGQKTQAADALLPLLDDPMKAPLHGEAWVKMGDLLASFDMKYSALIAYNNAIAADPEVGAKTANDAVKLSVELGDEALLAPVLASNVGLDVDKETRSQMAYIAARYNFQRQEIGTALGILRMVDSNSSVYADAEALRGVILSEWGKHNDALAPLLTAQQAARKANRGDRFDNAIRLNVARTYFGAGNYLRAIENYATVDRGSVFWPQAHFERAWAHFRQNDVKGTIAVLMSHDSPFFDDWYFPEADLLRTYALFMMCKFTDAGVGIDRFSSRYKPVRDQLRQTVDSMTPEQGYADALNLIEGRETTSPVMILRRFTSDARLLDAIESIKRADDELARLGNVAANPFARQAQQRLEERKATLIREEGERVIAHFTEPTPEVDCPADLEYLEYLASRRVDLVEGLFG